MTRAAERTADGGNTVSICSLRVGTGLFGIDTRQIREVLGTTTTHYVPLAPEYIAGVVPYRGEVLSAVSFRALLGLERCTGANCILVFDGEQNEERFGLIVDGVSGVIELQQDSLEANPSGLDARSMELFDGAYKLPSGLLVRLDPRKLRPARLAESGLFGRSNRERQGGPR
ncbi:MAG TPA: chemotaxis protein CheW [Acidobacteriaceae bacterium]|jgi:purine-binding chemotaxis protein CheW|nr:chemotaxis protein CheW [Acidobacteriaceae bacterium]